MYNKFELIQFNNTFADKWEELNKKFNGSFLSSLSWINFQKSLNKDTDQYLISLDGTIVGIIYIEIFKRKLAKFAYAPYGPVLDLSIINPIKDKFFKDLKDWQVKYAKSKGLNCFRMDPLLSTDYFHFQGIGYSKSLAPTQAKYSWQIDLTKSLDQLSIDLKKVARYNIKSSIKAGITVENVNSIEGIKEFYKIISATTTRQNFSTYQIDYFINQYTQLKNSGLKLYLAKYNNQYISGALINTYNNIGYYSHGGSINNKEIQKFGASYLLHWKIIEDLKNNGYKIYNMWGVVPENVKTNSTMNGVSDFKKRFGGAQINYVGGLDIKSNLKYYLQRAVEYFVYKKDRY